MHILIIIVSFFLGIYNVQAHEANIKGYNDQDTKYVSSCGGKYYGYHKKNGTNHWHEITFKSNKWQIVNSTKTYDSDPCQEESRITVSLKKCVDGDTAVFALDNKEVKFRFMAVDTPESVHPNKSVESYAKEASKSTCDLLTNAKIIQVEYDPNSDKTDKYDRQLAWIWVDNILLQKIMISGGYARVAYIYGKYKYVDELCEIQSKAVNEKKGIWGFDYEIGYCSTTKSFSSMATEDINLYKVTFVDNDNKDSTTIAEGMKVKEPKSKGKTGYKFVGWYNGENKYDFNLPIDGDLKLVAKYKIDYVFWIAIILMIISYLFASSKKRRKHGKNYQKSNK